MSERENLQNLLVLTKRRLAILEEQRAVFGDTNVPPQVVIQIQDAEKEIADLEQKLRQIAPNTPPNNRKLLMQFEQAVFNRDWETAILLGEEIMGNSSTNPQFEKSLAAAYYNRFHAHFEKSELERAFTDLTSAIHLNPHEPEYFYWRGVVHHNHTNYDSAIADLATAIKLAPEYPHPYYWRGDSYLKRNKRQQGMADIKAALEKYNAALQDSADDHELLYGRGLTLLALEQWLAAKADFEAALCYAVEPFIFMAKDKLAKLEPLLLKQEQERLLLELENLSTDHPRRMKIGDRLSEIGDPRSGVGVAANGVPDITWLPVHPGGKLKIGEQTFEIQPFYIAKYQVTYAQYDVFVQAADGYNNPEWWQGFPPRRQPQGLDERYRKNSNNPRDNISWYQSVAFGRWLNKRMRGWQLPNPGGGSKPLVVGENAQVRLPTEWEWQWAAQGGSQQREYPWGAWKEGYANTREAGLQRTTAVGMYPQGTAACGALDMIGNLWEWCQNKYKEPEEVAVDDSGDWRMLRGGSYDYGLVVASCVYRFNIDPDGGANPIGFRVVVCSANAPL
ncbi:SUMF1/EgtB/PvdO family nonheme iron enzyme [Candidatus Chlorohelix sp.]|uniref:SUMF1/EgtB/PvdO family nonheme iron enzyme n=1 Tax=Candidatus Chlorohelix sp. TaxID=3139201 RepID=UPI003071866A